MDNNRSTMEPGKAALQPESCVVHFLGAAHAIVLAFPRHKKKAAGEAAPMKTPGGRSRLRAQISVSHFASTTFATKEQDVGRKNFRMAISLQASPYRRFRYNCEKISIIRP